MIRIIRLLGAAIGLLVGISFVAGNGGPFAESSYAGALIAAWLVAWLVVGFALLPYLTVVPAGWLIGRVQELSTAEFVTAVVGLLLGLVMGLLLGLPLAAVPAPLGTWLPLGVSIFLGLGMAGLTVAKRNDLILAAEAIGIVRRPAAESAVARGRTVRGGRHERDHRRPDRRHRRGGVPPGNAGGFARRARRAAADRRQRGHAAA